MADVSPAKSFPESNVTSMPKEVDIVLGKMLNDERKLELIAKLKEFPCLWETSSLAYRVEEKARKKKRWRVREKILILRETPSVVLYMD